MFRYAVVNLRKKLCVTGGSSNGGGKVVIKTMDVYDENGNYVGSTHWYSDGTCDDPYSAGMGGF